MATAKWATPTASAALSISTTLNSLADGATSSFFTYDNSTNLDLYANINLNLGSFTAGSGGTVTLVAFAAHTATAPDNTGSVGGGDRYVAAVTVGASAKVINFPMVRLYPESMRFCVINNAGGAFAGSSNSANIKPFNESVA